MAEEIEVANLVTRITLDDTRVEQTLAHLNRQMRVVTSSLQAASDRLGNFGNSEEALRQRTASLSQQMQIQQQRIIQLQRRFQECATARGRDARETQNLEVQLNRAVSAYNRMHHELRQANEDLRRQTSILHRLGRAMDATAKKMERVGRVMMDAGQSLSLFVTAPLLALGATATKTSIEFETAFAGVKKTVDATEDEFKQLEKSILDMSKTIPATAVEIAKVVETAGQLGVQKDAIMGFTRTVVDLGVSTNLTAEEAATSFARLANVMNMSQKDFDKLGSAVVALGNNSATTEREIVEMSLRLGGAGHQVGLTEAQVVSFASALSSVGIEAEAGGTAFSKVMSDMAQAVMNGGVELEHFALVAGMSAGQLKEAFQQDASGALVSFIEGLGRMKDAGENTFKMLDILHLSEARVKDTLLRASGAGDLFRKNLELGSRAWKENVALTKEANEKYKITDSQLKILKNQVADASKKLGDALVPALVGVMGALKPCIESLGKCAEEFASLDASTQKSVLGWTAFAVALGPAVMILGQLAFAMRNLIPIVKGLAMAVKGLATAMMWLVSHPVIGATVLAVAALGAVFLKHRSDLKATEEATRKLGEAQKELQEIQQNGIDRSEVDANEKRVQSLNELIGTYQKVIEVAQKSEYSKSSFALGKAERELGVELTDLKAKANDFGVALEFVDGNGKVVTKSMNHLQGVLKTLKTAIADAKRETTDELNTLAKSIATKRRENIATQNLLKTYQSAKKGSESWRNAKKELMNMFPQFATATGVNTKAIQGLLLVKRQEIEEEWRGVQVKARALLVTKQEAIAKQEAAIKIAISIAQITSAGGLAEAALRGMNAQLERLRGEAASLKALMGLDFKDIALPSASAPKVPDTSSADAGAGGKKEKQAKVYENKRLDEAYKRLEHKKRLDQLTLESELKVLEEIRRKHIKTANERMEMDERIHDVRKAMGDAVLEKALKGYEQLRTSGKLSESQEISRLQRIQKKYADSAEERERLDGMIVEAQRRKVEAEKQLRKSATDYARTQLRQAYEDKLAREQLSAEESKQLQDKLLNEQIWLNKNYLEKVLADTRYTAKEKRDIERQVTAEIRKQTNERLQLRRRYAEDVQKQQEEHKKRMIDDTNKLSQGLQSALREKYQAEKRAEENRIRESMSSNEKWKKNQLDSVKSLYDERIKQAERASTAEIENIERVMNAQIEAVQAQLSALEQTEKQKSRAELDAEDQKKIDSLQGRIEYEHDDFNKIQLQKELNRVLKEREKRHQDEMLSDKKDALKEEEKTLKDTLREKTELLKTQLAEKKELLHADREAEVERINAIAEAQRLHYDSMLTATQTHYDQLLSAKNIQAEAEKMIVQNQQKDILKLLDGFGGAYNIAGQTLGEQAFQGFKGALSQIEPLLANVHAQISAARSAAISAFQDMTPSRSYGGGHSSSSSSSMQNISVTTHFHTPVTSPSDVNRASRRGAQQLAFRVGG